MLVEALGKAAAKGMGFLGAKQAGPEDRATFTAYLVKVKAEEVNESETMPWYCAVARA